MCNLAAEQEQRDEFHGFYQRSNLCAGGGCALSDGHLKKRVFIGLRKGNLSREAEPGWIGLSFTTSPSERRSMPFRAFHNGKNWGGS